MPRYAPLPVPKFASANPFADFAVYLHGLAQVRLAADYSARTYVLLACLGTNRYILLNQATVLSLCNFVISLLWLLYVIFLRNLWTHASDDPDQVELYIYFLNLAIALAFIPLFLCTYLLIAAGNLTTMRVSSGGLHKHYLSPLAVNSLLVVVFPALFLLLFVPGIMSGQEWSSYIGFVGEFEDQAIQNATAFAAAGDLGEPTRQAAITDMLSLLDSTLNPRRLEWIKLQRVINLLGLVFILRHVRQDRRGQLVFAGASVVAPLTSLAPSSLGAPDNAERTLSILPLHTQPTRMSMGEKGGAAVATKEEADYLNRTVEALGAEGTRPAWDITIYYFTVAPICVLLIVFIGWIVSTYGNVTFFANAAITELAATSVVWAYTVFSMLIQTALVVKLVFFSHSPRRAPDDARPAENPFNTRTGRQRRSSALAVATEDERGRSCEDVAHESDDEDGYGGDVDEKYRGGTAGKRSGGGGHQMNASVSSAVSSAVSFSPGVLTHEKVDFDDEVELARLSQGLRRRSEGSIEVESTPERSPSVEKHGDERRE
ncbi:hypothetical protein Rhopal_000121-T1 [Rhodotorula paludigena]|uniref:Proteophosphoglycan ppg4 n=1 Tax=Rhodotorula paludigena TaxID=86838 RepID=A0AAV5GC02_9BASI|nr:hypothetical protein Rhopal_000121-T1 [Rhodotorula paludigena]